MQILAGSGPTTLTKSWLVNGVATDVGDVTVGVTDANGDVVVAAGTATTNNEDGTYSYDLPVQADPAYLTVTWTDVDADDDQVEKVEIVGSELFTIAQARAYKIVGNQTPLSSTANYPNSTIAAWREQIAAMFEQRTGRSFVKRYCRVELDGNGGKVIYLADGYAVTEQGDRPGGVGRFIDVRRILSVTVNGTALSASDYRLMNNGAVRRLNGSWTPSSTPGNVVIEFEYGLPNFEAEENALRMLAANAVPTDVSSRATSFSNEDGTFRLTTFPVQVEEFLRSNDGRMPV